MSTSMSVAIAAIECPNCSSQEMATLARTDLSCLNARHLRNTSKFLIRVKFFLS